MRPRSRALARCPLVARNSSSAGNKRNNKKSVRALTAVSCNIYPPNHISETKPKRRQLLVKSPSILVRFEAEAVVKGIPAAALAYHNPGGVLLDHGRVISSEEEGAPRDSGQVGLTDGGAPDGRTCANEETPGGGGGKSIGNESSRFRCHLACRRCATF